MILTTGKCLLCLNESVLQMSHIVPKFASRELKKRNSNGKLINAMEPRKIIQDGEKKLLLCSKCEQLFSNKGEGPFTQQFYNRINQEYDFELIQYDEWLRYFAISSAWRIVTASLDTFRVSYPILAHYADIALETWRRYLLGESDEQGEFEHHLFFAGEITGTAHKAPPANFSDYIHFSTDYAIAFSDTTISAYTKLTDMAFWSTISPAKSDGWINTRILESGTFPKRRIAPSTFGDFLEDRCEKVDISRDENWESKS